MTTTDAIEPRFYTLEPGTPEWDAAWAKLAARSPADADMTAEHPTGGDCWQYMGSVRSVAGVRHEFRHRRHPESGERVYYMVHESAGGAG